MYYGPDNEMAVVPWTIARRTLGSRWMENIVVQPSDVRRYAETERRQSDEIWRRGRSQGARAHLHAARVIEAQQGYVARPDLEFGHVVAQFRAEQEALVADALAGRVGPDAARATE